MWIFTNFGAFSVVQLPRDPRLLQVRARDREHLRELRRHYVPGLEIVMTYETDYPYRAVCTRAELAYALDVLTRELDYANFKDSVQDETLHAAYFEIWRVLFRTFGGYLQRRTRKNRRRGGGRRRAA